MQLLDNFVLRTPSLAINEQEDSSLLKEAIYLSSPTLSADQEKFLSGKLDDSKAIRKLHTSQYKYLMRARNRCTPFGLFSTVGIGSFSEQDSQTLLDKAANTGLKRKTRLDMQVLCELSVHLSKQPYIRPYLDYFPNSSLYLIGNEYRYVEHYQQNGGRAYKISRVDYSDYLEFIFEESKNGVSLSELETILLEQGVPEEDARFFLHELVNEQLLVSELEPSLTGTDYFERILIVLERIHVNTRSVPLEDDIRNLQAIKNQLIAFDEQLFNPPAAYQQIHASLTGYIPELKTTNLLQSDVYRTSLSCNLNQSLQKELEACLIFLKKISNPGKSDNLSRFTQRFTERYEAREMPLLQVLDTENGIGYLDNNSMTENILIDDLNFQQGPTNDTTRNWSALTYKLHELLISSYRDNLQEIQLKEEDFDFMKPPEQMNLPATMYAIFNVLDPNSNEICFRGASGPSATNLISRFGHIDTALHTLSEQISDYENNIHADRIIASLSHLPQNRAGNVLSRPEIRNYELSFLTHSDKDEAHRINLSDLTISVRNNRVILKSKKLDKEVIPRIDNAHNYNGTALPVYYFLCDMQHQYADLSNLQFTWRQLNNLFGYFPRVKYRNCILSPQRWILKKEHFLPLVHEKDSHQQLRLFRSIQQKHKLPDKFLLVEGDHELLIDVTHPHAIGALSEQLKKLNSATLEEYLFERSEGNSFVRDTSGQNYTNECIAFLKTQPNLSAPSEPIKKQNTKEIVQRRFIPGSEWVYVKIYCGKRTSDRILKEQLKPMVRDLKDEKIIDQWFFIRYSDSGDHIRFRMHLPEMKHVSEVLNRFYMLINPLIQQDVISDFKLEIYDRELERYGHHTIMQAEQLFHLDSECITDLLISVQEKPELQRWYPAIKLVDTYLNSFGLDLNEKLHLTKLQSEAFFREHNGNTTLNRALSSKFRKLRGELELIFSEKENSLKFPRIEMHREQITPIIEEVKNLLQKHPEINLHDFLFSIIHMSVNRFFSSRQRTSEFIIYDILYRYYESALARAKKSVSFVAN